MQVRVLPDEVFGLIHGKAGIITYTDGSETSFLGSANESKTAWKLNIELIALAQLLGIEIFSPIFD